MEIARLGISSCMPYAPQGVKGLDDEYTFIISRSVLLRMRNVSDKSCRENQNTLCLLRFGRPCIVV